MTNDTDAKQGRGELTPRVQQKAVALFGAEITTRELRLMPYLSSCMQNFQRLEPIAINAEEREILSKWRKAGYIEGGASGLGMTKEFWDAMQELIWLAYCDLWEVAK